MKRYKPLPNKIYAVQVKTTEGWKIGPPMYGLDTRLEIVASQFMCKPNAENLLKDLVRSGMDPKKLRLVCYKFDNFLQNHLQEERIIPS